MRVIVKLHDIDLDGMYGDLYLDSVCETNIKLDSIGNVESFLDCNGYYMPGLLVDIVDSRLILLNDSTGEPVGELHIVE